MPSVISRSISPALIVTWLVVCGVAIAVSVVTEPHARAEPKGDVQSVQILTEDLPPFNYEEDGEVRGAAAEVVHAIRDELDLDEPIRVYPWVRTYEMALNEPNVAVFSLARIPERENQFHWIGVLAPATPFLFALESREDIQLDNLDDAREYSIGVFRRSAPETYLEARGFTVDEELISVYGHDRLYDLLRHERIDLWAVTLESIPHIVAGVREEPRAPVRPVLSLPELIPDNGVYLAMSRETPEETVEAFREAYQRVAENGTLENILSEHGMVFPASP